MSTLEHLINIAQQAGTLVMSIYNQPSFEVQHKTDQSALTQADTESHQLIYDALTRLFPTIPIISEESTHNHDYDLRKHWECFFLVDPLDGTKEFIQRNGEFTINIALIKNQEPILGVIHAPAQGVTYYAEKNKGSYKMSPNGTIKLPLHAKTTNNIHVVVSRSHCCSETENFIHSLQSQNKEVSTIPGGSALKFGLVAEGIAEVYPRFSPTMEWDTAAGQIIASEAGKQTLLIDKESILLYNKTELRNPGFIVQS